MNVFGVIGMLVCGGVLFAVNSQAEVTRQNERYGQDQNGQWHKMSDLAPGEYTCEGEGICSSEFTADPSESDDPESLRVPDTNQNGALTVNN